MLRPVYPIETARLSLRPFVSGDLDDLYAIQSLPEVARYLYWHERTRDEVRSVLKQKTRQKELTNEGQVMTLAVVLRETGTVIGEVNLRWLSRDHGQGGFGFVRHPKYQRQGYAREAAQVMLRLGFTGLGLHRIIGRCDARNVASATLMQRLGMRREAHFVENEIFKGEYGDEYVYAMLAREFGA